MSATATTEIDALETWFSSTNRLQIRCSASLLRRIDAEVVEAYSAIPRGGLEVGGVLFGTHDAEAVTVVTVRPIPCEHRFGPSFKLSDSDEAALTELLARDSESEPDLTGLEPVGWFHSHTRSALDLTEQDAYLHTKYFGKPWQVALILKPEQLRPTRAALYVPEEDGRLRPAAAENVIDIMSGRRRPADTMDREPDVPEAAVAVVPSTVDVSFKPAAPIRYAPIEPKPRSRRGLIAVGALIAGMLSAGLYTAVTDRSTPAVPLDIALRIAGTGEQLDVAWNPPRGGQGADLEIRDGAAEPQFVHLTEQQLAGGRLTYVRRAPEVTMRMRVYGATPAPADFVASFLGPPVPKGDVAPPAPAPAESAVASTVMRQTISEPVKPVAPPAAEPPAVRFPTDSGQRARMILPAPRPAQVPESPAVTPPPALVVNPELGSAPVSLTPIAPKPWTEPAPASQPVAQRRAPASGRAIWTGTLSPGASVRFEGGRASSGHLNGRLPQHAARITAHVADLGAAGIVVYTRDAAQRSRVGTSESPSARNGWNLTTWRWDERRGADIRVVEAPGPQNDWKRLTLRGEGKKISMLILEWEELATPPSK